MHCLFSGVRRCRIRAFLACLITGAGLLVQAGPRAQELHAWRAFAAADSVHLVDSETNTLVFPGNADAALATLGDGWTGQGVRQYMATEKDFWARSRIADIEVTVLRPRDRDLVLELRPAFHDAVGPQRVEVVWNQTRLGAVVFDLARGWEVERATFRVPRAAQTPGRNRITFVSRLAFSRGMLQRGQDRRSHAFSLLKLAITDPGALPDFDAPPEPARAVLDGEQVHQPANTLLKFPLRVPAQGSCRFVMEPPESDAPGATWSVRLRADGLDGVIDRALFNHGSPQPFEYDLALFRDQIIEIVFDTAGGSVPSAMRWRAPRILAENPPASQRYAPLDPAFKARNVILVICDAMRASGVGCYGYTRDTTPNIDSLAAEGVRFARAYAPAPYTYSSSWSLLTSLYPFQHNAPEQPLRVADVAPRLAQVLRAAGIYTGCLSQQHWISPKFGIAEHFDEWADAYETVEILNAGAHPDLLTMKAKEFLYRCKDRQFFLYLHYRPPHELYIPAAPYWDHFTSDPTQSVMPTAELMRGVKDDAIALNREQQIILRARYDENLLQVDAEVGKLRALLAETGLDDNTLLIVTSDHGEAFLEHGFLSHGETLYEEVTHVPLVFWGANIEKALSDISAAPVSTTFLYPTICDVLGAVAPENIAGRSLLRESGPMMPSDVRAYAQGNWLLPTHTWDPIEAFWWERFKLIRNTKGRHIEIYDLARDPEERRDLAPLRPVLTDYLLAHALAWRRAEEARASGPATEAQLDANEQERRQLEALGYLN
ncbi:MAG TPA: sulfatase [Candidatus Hydrogenedentes bacterium]|nr:sulfatase [Candidatus Hydrogenedentota bacterium]